MLSVQHGSGKRAVNVGWHDVARVGENFHLKAEAECRDKGVIRLEMQFQGTGRFCREPAAGSVLT